MEPDYKELITLKLYGLVADIMEQKQLSFNEALFYLYNSQLYDNLVAEWTKLWHLSNPMLLSLLYQEKATGEFIYPDFV